MSLRLLIAAGFAAAVLYLVSPGSGNEGMCFDEFHRLRVPEGSSGTETLSAWPPGIRCTTTFPSGETYERVYPRLGAWLAGAGAGLFVFGASLAFRRGHGIAR